MSRKGIVKIHGREYKTVARRVAEFHESRTETQRITTELVYHDDVRVIMKAIVWDGDVVIGCDYAEEFRESSKINQTSALENASTSAIGRALACIGLGGDEYASADEVLRAISQQENLEPVPKSPTKETSTDSLGQDEEWDSDIPEDILEVVKENYKMIQDRFKDANVWHKNILANFMGTKGEGTAKSIIKDLSREQLAELADFQNEHLKLNSKE